MFYTEVDNPSEWYFSDYVEANPQEFKPNSLLLTPILPWIATYKGSQPVGYYYSEGRLLASILQRPDGDFLVIGLYQPKKVFKDFNSCQEYLVSFYKGV